MPLRTSFQPRLEILEDRFCPALTIHSHGPDLLITGTPTMSLAGVTITGVGGTNFDIKDGIQDLGTYSITRNLTLNLNHYTSPITLDLHGQALGGNVLFQVGAGNTFGSAQPISIISSKPGGIIDGSIDLLGGSGDDTLDIGSTDGTQPVSINGSVVFSGRNTLIGNSDTLAISDGSSVGGNVAVASVANIEIGDPSGAGAFIGHTLAVNDSNCRYDMTLGINKGSEIGGDVRVTGTNRFVASGDRFIVQSGATIVGNTSVNLGNNTNLWELGGTFDGSVRLIGGSGITPPGGMALNTIELDDGSGSPGTFNKSVTASTGNGSTAFIFNTADKIVGNLDLSFGSGVNDLGGGSLGGVFDGTVSGDLSIHLGNGLNTAVLQSAPGGRLRWNSGNGDSSLTLASDLTHANTFWRVQAHFGFGANDFILDPNAPQLQYLSGGISAAAGTDVFTNEGLAWVLSPSFTIGKDF
jgi:hypothetical protein